MIEKTKIEKINLNVLGVVLRVSRMEKGYSLRQLAQITNISHTLISNIEKGKQTPSEMTLKEIFTALDIHLDISEKLQDDMAYYYRNIFTDLLNYKYDRAKIVLDELELRHEEFMNSLELVNYQLIRGLYYTITKTPSDFIDMYLTRYRSIVNFLTDEQLQLYRFISGLNELNKYNFSGATTYFVEAIKVGDDELDVFIKEYLVRAYLKQFKFTDSVSICTSIIEEFEKRTIYLRAMRCRLLIARVYLTILKLDQVIKLVEFVEQFAEEFHLQDFIDECHIIRANVYFFKQQYKLGIDELDKISNSEATGMYYSRFRMYLLSKDERLVDYYNDIIKYHEQDLTRSTFLLIKVFMKYLNKEYRDETYLPEIIELKDLSINGNDQEIIGLTMNILIEYYKEDRKYKKALEYSEELLNHKKIHISHYFLQK